MLAIQKKPTVKGVVPNLLPCSIKHNGATSVSTRHWTETVNDDDSRTAYFRGRKLAGTVVDVPEGYQGVLLLSTAEKLPTRAPTGVQPDYAEVDQPAQLDTSILQQEACFDSIKLWGHEAVPSKENEHSRAIEEWIAFAEAVSRELRDAGLTD